MTASTYYDSDHQPYYGPLNGKRGPNGAWCSKTTSDRSDYLQADMGAVQSVCAVATEGTTLGHFVTNCKLRLSLDGATFTAYKEKNAEKVRKYTK